MSVLFIGGVFSDENQSEIIRNTRGYAEFSANIFQKKLITGFKRIGMDTTVLSAPFIGSYPNRYKKIFFNGFASEQTGIMYVKFCNIWGYRNFSRAAALKKEIKRIILKDKKAFDLILVYSAHEPFLEAALYAKKLLPKSKICFIVPDLPQYMNLDVNKTKIYDFFKKYDIEKMEKLIKKVDTFVILTRQMKEVLHIGNRPYIVVEGIIDELPKQEIITTESAVKNIVYTGKINFAFGIRELIESFMRLSGENYRLVLCGDGDARDYVIEKAVEDKRIEFKGQIEPNEAKEIINGASVLVNPRPNNEEYTKYSFPSKNIEYLMSGNPVVAYMLDGIPEIYKNFIELIPNVEELPQILKNISNDKSQDKYYSFIKYAKENLMTENVAKRILEL